MFMETQPQLWQQALSAFYYGAKICHVEAGLRTNNILTPFQEEMNRRLQSRIKYISFYTNYNISRKFTERKLTHENIYSYRKY